MPVSSTLNATATVTLFVQFLLQGESGPGKEAIAHALHQASPRAHKPFVAVNCGALQEPLMESESCGVAGVTLGQQR